MASTRNHMAQDYLTQALDQRLRVVLLDLFRDSLRPDRPDSLTVGSFLCALYFHYPEEVKDFFYNPDRLSELQRRFRPPPIKDMGKLPPRELADCMAQKARATGLEIPAVGQGQALALDFRLESSLASLLREAIALAAAAGREKTGIGEFIGAFTRNSQLVEWLYKETGLLPKGRTPEAGH
jgi:hypothetical protein